ncbi:MAG: DUF4363 family protein [Clostridia bacterium]|nr:DUF4363 family protein [Clostridia bacterium]
MKAFIVSVCVLTVIIALSIFNSVYINNVTSTLLQEAEFIEMTVESVSRFKELWSEHEPFIRLSSSHKETHRIDEVISVLMSKAEDSVQSGFDEERALLIEYLTQIKEDETVSFDSII